MTSPRRRVLIRVTYLLPLLCGALLTLPFLIRHTFLMQDGELTATFSLAELLDYLYENTGTILSASGAVERSSYDFALLVRVLTVASLFFAGWYLLFAVSTAVISCVDFARSAPDERLNTVKRVWRIAVPNRGFYVFFCLLPILPAAMPYLYAGLLRSMLGHAVKVYLYGPPDLAYAIAAGLACAIPFLVLLKAQKDERMDLFRLYRAGAKK